MYRYHYNVPTPNQIAVSILTQNLINIPILISQALLQLGHNFSIYSAKSITLETTLRWETTGLENNQFFHLPEKSNITLAT